MKTSHVRLAVVGLIGAPLMSMFNTARSGEALSRADRAVTDTYTLKASGLTRQYVVHVPRGYDKH
jgi:poly(3-hydroxybutyrate) depolymerase